jgi:hypothetical protein
VLDTPLLEERAALVAYLYSFSGAAGTAAAVGAGAGAAPLRARRLRQRSARSGLRPLLRHAFIRKMILAEPPPLVGRG